MIQILPVESKVEDLHNFHDFFFGKEHFYTMEMQNNSFVMGSGLIYVKGECAYLLSLKINDLNESYMIVDSILRSLMNFASLQGAVLFHANELAPCINYFKNNQFCEIVQFSALNKHLDPYNFYVNIEQFFSKPCRG